MIQFYYLFKLIDNKNYSKGESGSNKGRSELVFEYFGSLLCRLYCSDGKIYTVQQALILLPDLVTTVTISKLLLSANKLWTLHSILLFNVKLKPYWFLHFILNPDTNWVVAFTSVSFVQIYNCSRNCKNAYVWLINWHVRCFYLIC